MAKMIKVSVNLSEKVVAALREYAKAEEITMTEGIRRAISMQKFLHDQVRAGGKILIEKVNGKMYEIVLPWCN
jgi:hypothetical protein